MNWMKYRLYYFALSLLVILPGAYSLVRFGLNPSVEFTGGAVYQLKVSPADKDQLSKLLEGTPDLNSFTLDQDLLTLKLGPITQQQATNIKTKLDEPLESLSEISFTTIGPSVGHQLLLKVLTAVSLAALATLLYIAYAFKSLKFGLFAVVATLHDTLVVLGTYSLIAHFFNYTTDLLFVTALLTTISFSVHDTIVVYDRIRELKHRHSNQPLEQLANQAVTETIVRSLNNSLTIIFMLLALFLMGGSSLKTFSLGLLIGAVTGTYSSTFTAVPLLVTWDRIKNR